MEENKEYQLQDNSDVEGSVMLAAKKNYAQGNYQEALKLLQNAMHTNSDTSLYVDIGNCYYMLGNQNEAASYWERAINLDPKNSQAYANLGNLNYKNRQVEKAISYWLVALISRPEDGNTCLNLAVAFNQKEMRFEAIKYFEKYIKYAENKTSAEYAKVKQNITHCFQVANELLIAGAQLHSEGHEKKAAEYYFKSLANYPNLSKTNLNLGSIFFTDKNLELAIKYWTVASHIDPEYAKIYANLAISYDMLKKFDYAYCYYNRYMNYIMNDKQEYYKTNQRLLKIKPFLNENQDLTEKHLKKAQEHLSKSEFYEAIDEFKNYSILKPEENQQYKEIIKKLESYLNPEVPIISSCFEIGNKLIAEGKYKEAKPYFFRIMNLSSPQYLEFSKAKAKYSHCEKSEAGIF